MPPSKNRPFSLVWVFISMGVFVGIEMVLGGLLGKYVVGRYLSMSLRFTLQGLLHVTSYFLGGIIVGFISPGIRIKEPAIGAFLAVLSMMLLTFFTPYTFIRMTSGKLFIGGAIAFVLALAGARIGERIAGNMK